MAEDIIKDLVKTYSKDIIMLDALLQWALNPTPKSTTGYGIKENYHHIEQNLRITHNLTSTESEKVIEMLREDCSEFINLMKADDLGNFRNLIKKGISQPQNIKLFEKFILKRRKDASENVLNFLHVYINSPIKDFSFLNVQFNAIYGEDLKSDELIRLGILKILYWISSGNIHNREKEPKFIPFLDLIVDKLRLKKWKIPEYDLKNFVDNLKASRDFNTLNFLKYLFRRNELYTSIYPSLINMPVTKKGFIGAYSSPFTDSKYAGVSFLIQKQLFNLMEEYIAEELQEKTRKIIKILEHEMVHGEQLSDKEIVRLFDVYIDEVEEYKTLMNVLPIESFPNNQDINNKASMAIEQFDDPSLYNLLRNLQFDIETARRVGKFLIDNKMIDMFWRLPKKFPSSTSLKISAEMLEELECGECGTNLSKKFNLYDLKNQEPCPCCGSTNIIKTKKK